MTLHAVPPAALVYRVTRGGDGPSTEPFAPPDWKWAGADGTFGNRFDDPGAGDGIGPEARFRMVYCATQRAGAFGETIAHFRPDLRAIAALAAIADAAGGAGALAGKVPAAWWRLRVVGRLRLDPTLRFVDVTHPDTLADLRTALARLAVGMGEPDVDISTLMSQRRTLTQRVARYVYERRTADGTSFAGVRYLSRHHAAWECWAVFADRLAGERLASEPVTPDDTGLTIAAGHFGLAIQRD